MKTIFFTIVCFFISELSFSQENKVERFIEMEGFPKIIVVPSIAHHAQSMLTINVYHKISGKAEDKDFFGSVSYLYLGIDNQTLRLRRIESEYSTKMEKKIEEEEDINELYFKLDSTKPTEITLIGQRHFSRSVIKLSIEASNNFIKVRYIGKLPIYSE